MNAPDQDKKTFLIGLSYDDMTRLKMGGVVTVNPKVVGMIDLDITIFLGGTDERMAEKMKKYDNDPDTRYKIVNSDPEVSTETLSIRSIYRNPPRER